MTQNNLGNALSTLGERESGTARLEEAVDAYRKALKERTRERAPLQWAATQNNLGTALIRLGGRESGTARLEEAVDACREALKECTRERVPLDWAMSTGNQGEAHRILAERRGDLRIAENAIAQITAAVETFRNVQHAPNVAYYEIQLSAVRALIERLHKE
jgi:tetratricopeptide (TPR) repeat protein